MSISGLATATSIKPTDLATLVAKADYIVVGKVVKVDLADSAGYIILDENAGTSPKSGKTIRYHVVLHRYQTLKGNIQKVPETLILPDWPMWIRKWKDIKKLSGKTFIFLLKADFSPQPPSQFIRDISEKGEIVNILNSHRGNTK